MIKINNIRLNAHEDENLLAEYAAKVLGIGKKQIHSLRIKKKSLDARRKNDIHYSYTVYVCAEDEESLVCP